MHLKALRGHLNISGTRRALGHVDTWRALRGHSGTWALKALGHLGTATFRAPRHPGTWALKVLYLADSRPFNSALTIITTVPLIKK